MAQTGKKPTPRETEPVHAPANTNRAPKPRLVVDNTNPLHPTVNTEYLKKLEKLDKQRGINAVQIERKKNDPNRKRNLSREERIRQINARGKGTLLRRTTKNQKLQRLQKGKERGKSGLLKKTAATAVFRLISYAAPWIWITQLTFAILTLIMIFIADASFTDAIIKIGKGIGDFSATEVIVGLVEGATSIATALPAAVTSLVTDIQISWGLAFGFYFTTVIIGYLALAIVWIMYKIAPVGIHPTTGGKDHSKTKILILLFSIVLHAVPFTNFVPWFWFWAWYIKKHPA